MVESALFSVLSTSSPITSLIGTRIFPAVMPEDATMPALLYYFIGGQVSTTLDTRGTQRSRVQFDCFADTYADAATLRNAVIDAIAGYTSFAFACQIISTRDSYDHELKQYIAVVEVYLTYSL